MTLGTLRGRRQGRGEHSWEEKRAMHKVLVMSLQDMSHTSVCLWRIYPADLKLTFTAGVTALSDTHRSNTQFNKRTHTHTHSQSTGFNICDLLNETNVWFRGKKETYRTFLIKSWQVHPKILVEMVLFATTESLQNHILTYLLPIVALLQDSVGSVSCVEISNLEFKTKGK